MSMARPKLPKQKKREKDNDFSNRKAAYDSAVRQWEKQEADRDADRGRDPDEVPPHIVALRRVFGKD
jgi:hypothetical protein